MFIYGSEKKPTGEKKPTIVVWKQVPIPVLLEAISLCGLRKEAGFYQQETSSLFSDKQTDTWGYFLPKKKKIVFVFLIMKVMRYCNKNKSNSSAYLCWIWLHFVAGPDPDWLPLRSKAISMI